MIKMFGISDPIKYTSNGATYDVIFAGNYDDSKNTSGNDISNILVEEIENVIKTLTVDAESLEFYIPDIQYQANEKFEEKYGFNPGMVILKIRTNVSNDNAVETAYEVKEEIKEEVVEQSDYKFCPYCGTPLNGGKFCSNCGAKNA